MNDRWTRNRSWMALAASVMLVGPLPLSSAGSRPRPASAPPTASIYGTVTSARTGRPIPGIAVIVAGTHLGSPTTREGRYGISRVPITARELQFQGTCFRTVTVDIASSLSPDKPLRVDVGLPFERLRSRPGVIVPPWACQEFEGR